MKLGSLISEPSDQVEAWREGWLVQVHEASVWQSWSENVACWLSISLGFPLFLMPLSTFPSLPLLTWLSPDAMGLSLVLEVD
jgi:hypothetical protein